MTRFALAAARPAAGSAAMATGIVSAALLTADVTALSEALMWVTLALWLALGSLLAVRVVVEPVRVRADAATPAALTGVAATAVLGSRLVTFGAAWAGAAMLALAALGLAALAPLVLRRWQRPATGSGFLLAVATEGLAVLAATVAATESARWLMWPATALIVAGALAYAFVLSSFDLRQLLDGAGDHWVAGGALAIAALAAAKLTAALARLHAPAATHDAGRIAALALWSAAIAWLPPLVASELARPRLRFDIRRWATVFPLGMYADMSMTVGRVAGAPPIDDLGHVVVWVAFAAWAVVSAAALARPALRRERISAGGGGARAPRSPGVRVDG